MKSLLYPVFAGAALLCLSLPASAQRAPISMAPESTYYQELIQNVNHHSKRYHRHYRHGRVCKKLCAHDYSPCDPMSFKRADNRCSERR
jgi:hypothetical protein